MSEKRKVGTCTFPTFCNYPQATHGQQFATKYNRCPMMLKYSTNSNPITLAHLTLRSKIQETYDKLFEYSFSPNIYHTLRPEWVSRANWTHFAIPGFIMILPQARYQLFPYTCKIMWYIRTLPKKNSWRSIARKNSPLLDLEMQRLCATIHSTL